MIDWIAFAVGFITVIVVLNWQSVWYAIVPAIEWLGILWSEILEWWREK